jgi:NAD(P)-dependent dehydrogenase (short-subunit alcohol dehydrogenase family)
MTSFAHSRVLVVGGTSGVGLATAHRFLAQGAETVIASRSRAKLDAAVTELARHGTKVEARVLDLRVDTEVEQFGAAVGEFDHVVVTAGETPMGRLDSLPIADAYGAMDSKFWGAYRLARAVRIAPGGSLTLVSGYLSQRPGKASALQGAINAALEALVRGLAVEQAPLRVNAVSPGLLRTPLWSQLPADAREQMYAAAADRLPARRVGEADDVADAILFVAGNPYSTGTTLFVDGGGLIA